MHNFSEKKHLKMHKFTLAFYSILLYIVLGTTQEIILARSIQYPYRPPRTVAAIQSNKFYQAKERLL